MTSSLAALAASCSLLIDNRPLRVFDGHLPEPGRYARELSNASFTKSEIARPETGEYRHWV